MVFIILYLFMCFVAASIIVARYINWVFEDDYDKAHDLLNVSMDVLAIAMALTLILLITYGG